MTPQRIQVFSLALPPRGTPTAQRRYIVRWRVDGRDKKRRFKTKAEGDRYRSQLLAAIADGQPFDRISGLPKSWIEETTTWWAWSQDWLALKWPRWAGGSRKSGAEALVAITPHLIRAGAPAAPSSLRQWLWDVGYDPAKPIDVCTEARWLEKWSIPLARIEPGMLEDALTAATTRLDGRSNAPTVAKRRRDLVNAAMKAAVRRRLIDFNPMERIEWQVPRRTAEVDISILPSLADVDALVAHVSELRTPGARFAAFFAMMGFAGLRPSEAADLSVKDIHLPDNGWGKAYLRSAAPSPGTRYTDTDSSRRA